MTTSNERFEHQTSLTLLSLAQIAQKEAALFQDPQFKSALLTLSSLYLSKLDLESVYLQIANVLQSVANYSALQLFVFEQDECEVVFDKVDSGQENVHVECSYCTHFMQYAREKRSFVCFDNDTITRLFNMDSAAPNICPKTWIFLPFNADKIHGGISLYLQSESKKISVNELNALIILTIHIGNLLCHQFVSHGLFKNAITEKFRNEYRLSRHQQAPTTSKKSYSDSNEPCPEQQELNIELLKAENQIVELTQENILLKREADIKSALFELTQLYSFEGKIEELFSIIFHIVSNLIKVDNFYIAILDEGLVSIPFLVDIKDNFEKQILHESTNPNMGKGLTAYALHNGKSLIFSEADIVSLNQQGKLVVIGELPKQWCFMPFRSVKLQGGISVQSYADEEQFTLGDITVLNFFSMHIGNLLTLRFTRDQLEKQYDELKRTQVQLVQSEKLASIGQLAAGVAHEINNPLGYVGSNLGSLKSYLSEINEYLDAMERYIAEIGDDAPDPVLAGKNQILKLKKDLDIDYLKEDINELIKESMFGMDKVRDIVQSLKNFSRIDQEVEAQQADLNECIEQTLKIVWNDLKYKCEVEKQLGEIPDIYCFPGQLNQVIMNLLVNAGHAIEEKGKITIVSKQEGDDVLLRFSDSGKGISPENIPHLFEPFYTTKPVGQGTGLGLSISYGIIQKHHGEITVESEVGVGTTFQIRLPIHANRPETEKDTDTSE